MKIAVMQPYFFPYAGYFQLMNAVDEFIVYDNIQYSKEGWINRNRILSNGKPCYFTVPLKKDSDFLDVRDRYISPEWKAGRKRALNKLIESYRKAPYFGSVYPMIESSFMSVEENLFEYIYNSLEQVRSFIGIRTSIVVSSSVAAEHNLKSADRVISICHARKADNYINPEGGVGLYDRDYFKDRGLKLNFLRSTGVTYPQYGNEFVPSLSIIDVLMFNSVEQTRAFLETGYEIS